MTSFQQKYDMSSGTKNVALVCSSYCRDTHHEYGRYNFTAPSQGTSVASSRDEMNAFLQ